MEELMKSEIFFFISSIGFVVLGVLAGIALYYIIRASKTLHRIVDRAEKDVDEIGEITTEALEDIKDSWLFHFLFKKKKKKTRK